MNEEKEMRSPDALRPLLEDIRFSLNTDEFVRGFNSITEAISKLANESARQSAVEALAQAERDRRWREDPLNLMPYLRFEGVRYIIADGLRAIADWLDSLPETSDYWLDHSPQAKASVERGLFQAKSGKVHRRSFIDMELSD